MYCWIIGIQAIDIANINKTKTLKKHINYSKNLEFCNGLKSEKMLILAIEVIHSALKLEKAAISKSIFAQENSLKLTKMQFSDFFWCKSRCFSIFEMAKKLFLYF